MEMTVSKLSRCSSAFFENTRMSPGYTVKNLNGTEDNIISMVRWNVVG